jgi:membrane protein
MKKPSGGKSSGGKSPGGVFQLLKAAFKDFGEDECGIRAAALAYFTVFALPPLLTLLIMVAGMVWDPQDVQKALTSQFSGMMGESGGQQISTIIAQADKPGSGGLFATLASIAGLVFGATGAFIQLQGALNRAWEVKPDPAQGGVMRFITKRLLSLGMVLGIGFLLAVSLALSAGVSAVGGAIGSGIPEPVLHVLNFAVSFLVLGLLFSAMFKVLPDAKVAWRDVWVGGFVTALLFVLGKFAIGLYLGRSSPGDAFGAAGALAVVLVWAYYSGMILLFGAEFTQQWAVERGSGVEPKEGAVHVVEKEEVVRPGDARAAGGRQGKGGKGGKGGTRDLPAAASGRAPRASTDRARDRTTAPEPAKGTGLVQTLLGVPLFFFFFGRKRGGRDDVR